MEPARGGLIALDHGTLIYHNCQTSKSLDKFSWYGSLYNYSHSRGDEDGAQGPNAGQDDDLVSAMISTTVAPLICKLLEAGALDPYSAVDTGHMIDVAEQVEASIGKDNHKFQVIKSFMIMNKF